MFDQTPIYSELNDFDDSKFERELVRNHLPMVEVPNIGNDPEKYIFHIDRAKYFENIKKHSNNLTGVNKKFIFD